MRHRTGLPGGSRAPFDWRGWIALAWVLWWAWAYGLMAIQARAPQVIAWVRSLWTTPT